ncbi:hypothetical protein FRC08_016151 [Ceratobasidium sp. 394]|nr:hypothetical protein FRC08_016151 [Ceratobasidium sp. 394]
MSIIFVDERELAFRIYRILRNFFPPELAGQIEVYHALQSTIAKEYAAKRFEAGTVRVLICTEALTMGCDFRKIEQVIMFKVPITLPTVLQRGGRGGRDKTIWCRVVLMVEGSKHKAVLSKVAPGPEIVKNATPKKEEDEPLDAGDREEDQVLGVNEIEALERVPVGGQGEGEQESEAADKALRIVSAQHGKEDEGFLRQFYAPTDHCRTFILDTAFCSPPHPPCISVNGCDNCIRRRIKQLESKKTNKTHLGQDPVKQEPVDDVDLLGETVEDLRALLVEPGTKEIHRKPANRGKYRRKAETEVLEEVLKVWRGSTYDSDCKRFGIHADYVITDKLIHEISRLPPPVALKSLSETKPAWPAKAFARWGRSLLSTIEQFDLPDVTAGRKRAQAQLRKEIDAKQSNKKARKGAKHAEESVKTEKRRNTSPAAAPESKKPKTRQADSAVGAGPSPLSQATTTTPTRPNAPTQAPTSTQPIEIGLTQLELKPSLPDSRVPPNQPLPRSHPNISPRALPVSRPFMLPHPATSVSATTQDGQLSASQRAVGTIQVNTKLNMTSQAIPLLPNPSAANPVGPTRPTVKNPAARRDYYPEHTWR